MRNFFQEILLKAQEKYPKVEVSKLFDILLSRLEIGIEKGGDKKPLNKPIRTPGEKKKFKVYVKDPKTGNVVTVRFGDPNMKIKSHVKGRKKSYCSRSSGIKGKNDKTSANYWSRKMWNC